MLLVDVCSQSFLQEVSNGLQTALLGGFPVATLLGSDSTVYSALQMGTSLGAFGVPVPSLTPFAACGASVTTLLGRPCAMSTFW